MLRSHFPTEAAIRRVLLPLRAQPGRLQEIAEDFFEAREGLRPRPIGRNSDGVPIKGYPDAYAIQRDGRMAVLEVTAGNWRAHVRDEDTPRLASLGVGVVGKYTLVVFRDEETPIPQKNARRAPDRPNEDILRREIAATCGIDPANVQFVFLKQFIRELRQPIHVPLLLKLGLSVSPAPFQIASEVLPHGIPEITPSREEFEQALVVPLNALDDLLRALRDSDHVVLAGEGASGKTSLALSAGHRWVMDGGVALYFDCSNYDLV